MTILPPPPSFRVVLWAALVSRWFRLAATRARIWRRAVQAARRLPILIGPQRPAGSLVALARAGRLSSLAGRLARDHLAHSPLPHLYFPDDDRPTVIEGRR